MKRIITTLILIALTILKAGAQMPGGMKGGIPKMGKVYGKVTDAKSDKAIDAATVLLLQVQNGKDVLVKNVLTEPNGEFSLDELPMMGQFKLSISAPGYKPYEVPVAFDLGALMKAGAGMRGSGGGDMSNMTSIPAGATDLLNALNKDLGTIRIEALNEQLAGVTVTANVPAFTLQGEKKIFNVDKNLTSQGGTAQDVMKNVPGVLVDADGKVTIRNSQPQLLIDGRQSPLQLDQIPADAIESVEVVTNPSSKYDAEGGTGGVLNIVLKKNRKTGYNGGIRAGVDSRGGGNLGGDFNYRTGKFNISLVGHSNLMRNRLTGTNERTDFSTDPDQYTFQDDVNQTRGGFAFGRIGLDYFVTNRTTLSLGFVKVHGQFRPDDNLDITTDSLYTTGIRTAWSQRRSEGNNQFDMNGMQLGMKRLFTKPGREWTVDVSANRGKNTNSNTYTTMLYNDYAHTDMYGQAGQRTAGNGENNFYTIQSDFVQPMRKSDKLEFGVKATIRQVKSNIDNYVTIGNIYTLVPNIYSQYKNLDQVYAAYASYSGNINANTSYQAGLRAENSQYEGTLEKNGQTFSNSYPVSLFPSLFLTHKMKKDQQLQFTYRRGINRPNFFQQLPFTDYTDPLNIRQGNPGLKPEFTNTVEGTYMKNFTRTNYVMASVYYRRSDNLITQYQTIGINPFTNDAALISSYINASSSDRYGLELTSGWDVYKWWNVLANVNVYNATLNTGEAGSTDQTNTYFSGFGKLTNNFKLPKKLSFQLSGVYQSRTNLLPDSKNEGPGGGRGGGFMMQSNSSSQGYLDANWSVDAALRWTFMKNDMASLSLSVNDIFASRRFTQHTENEYFVQDYSRLVNPQLVRLNFSWRFGKIDTDLFRRKNLKGQMEGMQDASQNIGM
jgi:outer membrane receptor protein involved in Fe transport